MKRLIKFAKIEATGNDFIVIDAQANSISELSREQISGMCAYHTGVGADGLLLIFFTKDKPPQMKYYNPDGLEANMCGNGLRAAVLFTYVLGNVKADKPFKLLAADGLHSVIINSKDDIKVEILPRGSKANYNLNELPIPDGMKVLGFTDTGVPHLVIKVENDLAKADVHNIGRQLRNHLMFAGEGTNINFLKVLSDEKIQIRTYERGVERETLSCGTGVVASALLSGLQNKKINIQTNGGNLQVTKESDRIFLRGPARIVFTADYLL